MKVMTMVATALVCVSAVFSADVEQLKNLPRGVQSIKYNEKGVISTLVVVGKAAVPTALRRNAGRAAQYGGEKARGEAQLEFTRFLSTKCKWGKTSTGETAVAEAAASTTDAAGNEVGTGSSSFTETEMTKEEKAQSAQACVSAIQVLWEGMNDSGEYAWVGAWNAKALNSLKGMVKKMNEVHAEVDSMAAAEKAKKAEKDKQELEKIKQGKGEAGKGTGARDGKIDLLDGVKKPGSKPANDADAFL